MYSLNASLYSSVFVVPRVLVDKYIKLASFCAQKSLLWILNYQGGAFSVADIAKGIGSSEADVKEALDFWVNEGILVEDGKQPVAAEQTKSDSHLLKDKDDKKKEYVKKEIVIKEELIQPTDKQVSLRINEDKRIKDLMLQAQSMLGRTFGYDTQAKFIQMIDGYGLPYEIILILIQYCIDIGKTSNAFMLSIAKSWYNKDIFTPEQAYEYINTHTKAQKIYYEFRLHTGLSAPLATPKQEEFFLKWNSYNMSVEMMVNAYHITVEKKGTISFPYMDKIISSWHENGYKTPEDVEKAKQAKNKSFDSSNASYDIEKAISQAENDDLVYEKKRKTKRGESK